MDGDQNTTSGISSIFGPGGKTLKSLDKLSSLLRARGCGILKILDFRSRATRTEQMQKNTALLFLHFTPRIRSMFETASLLLAPSVLAWLKPHGGKDKGNNPLEIENDSSFNWP